MMNQGFSGSRGQAAGRRDWGVTLIELLLALIMSMLGLSIIITIYLTAQKSSLIQSDLSFIQENARIVTELLNAAIRRAGYIGCAKLTDHFPLTNSTSYEVNSKNKMTLKSDSNSDVMTIRSVSLRHAVLMENMRDFSEIYTTLEPRFYAGDIVLIADCKTADIFQVKHAMQVGAYQKIIAAHSLSTKYEKYSELGHLEINTYFIEKTTRKTITKKPIYALYVRDIHNKKMELAENIDHMTIHFDYDSTHKVGVEMTLLFSALQLKKQWNSYIALRDSV